MLAPYHQDLQRAACNGLRRFQAVPPLRLSEWAEQHFYLSAESSYVEQRWVAYPFQRGILDCMGNDAIEEVVVRKSARVGYTKMLLAAIGYFAQHKRRNQGVWQPTDEDSDEFVKGELEPMFRDVPIMADVFPEHLQRHKHNTLRQKIFRGSILYLRGGKAAKNYRRLTLSTIIIDEGDGFDRDVEGEGSPWTLAWKRLQGAIFPKGIIGSTPKTKHLSLIEDREAVADVQLTFQVPCPHCGERQALRWGGRDKPYGMKWTNGDAETVAYLCEACQALFGQADYLRVWDAGRWTAADGTWLDDEAGVFRDPRGARIATPRAVAFFAWTAMSPQASWVQIVREWLAANLKATAGDDGALKAFINTTLGESYEEDQERAEPDELKRRCEPYRLRTLPRGVLVLVAGVDVQDNRFEVVVWGVGRGEEMWPIDYTVLAANPGDERDWQKLDAYLQSKFKNGSGIALGIEAVAVDTGGHFSHQVYNFCRQRARRRIYAIKGETRDGQPVKGRSSLQDVNYRGAIIKRGVRLWAVGTDTAKDLLFGRLEVKEPGPGYVHFSDELGDDFFAQLTAEARVPQRTSGGMKYRWVCPPGRRNEVLDCTVYAIFAAHMLDLNRYTERMWQKLEAAVQPPTADMFDPATADQTEEPEAALPVAVRPVPPPVQRRRTGRIGSFRG